MIARAAASQDTVARRLAQFIVSHGRNGLHPDTTAYQKALLLDFLGVALYAVRATPAARTANLFRRLGGAEESTALVGGRLPAPAAAYINGILAHAADWDDSHLAAVVHPGAVVLPAVLAMGERRRASGADLIAAAVVGYETTIRLGLAVQPRHMFQGFHGTATCGIFGSAAASARLLGLDEAATANALALAASSASGLTQFFRSGSSVKSIQAGKSSHDGVMAALLAENGVDAPHDAIEGEKGFFRAYAAGAAPSDPLDGLGGRDAVLDVMIKRFPIAAHLHGAVDAAMRLADHGAHGLERIGHIEVVIDPAIAVTNNEPRPRDLQAARMSLPFCTACAIWANAPRPGPERRLDPADLESALRDDGVRRLAERVHLEPWPEAAAGAIGRTLRARVALDVSGECMEEEASPLWGWRGAVTVNEAADKFSRLTGGMLDARARERMADAVLRLDQSDAAVAVLYETLRAVAA
jgi:2-methylcitrate dehydratase PrpD